VTAVAPDIDRGWDRRDTPREPGRPEPDTAPQDARWAALVDGLPDAFIEPDATAEQVAELRRRLGMPAAEWPERPPAEPADTDRVARRLRELETEGHGPQRHEGQVTDQQLQDRVLHGHDPAQQGPDKTVDAVTGQPHEPPRIACRFDTSEAMVAADDALRASDAFVAAEAIAREEGDGKLTVRLSLDQALPEALRAQVTGFARAAAGDTVPVRPVDFTDGRVQGVYRWDDATRGWVTHTIYPDRRRSADEGREP
jgi:hypothetical protein